MKVTYNWLKDYVDLKINPQDLADKLTMAGIEVKSIDSKEGDFVFEIEITSNRPDWLSVIGLAREVAAITNSELKLNNLNNKFNEIKNKETLDIQIDDKSDCSIYTGKIIRNVKVGASPEWLRKRLELVGCRSINNIVDITNYVLFELGEPLHAFDLDKLASNKIIVRRAKLKEKITTIDNFEKELNENILVIADEKHPIAVAGVMGGKETEVTEQTKNILLEAANFNSLVVRRSRYQLGLQTEASYRFERSVDPASIELASNRALELIKELSGGEFTVEAKTGNIVLNETVINLDLKLVEKILNSLIPVEKIKNILTPLGFNVKDGGNDNLLISVPSYRPDAKIPEDILEEIARVFGYENIPVSLPKVCFQEITDQKILYIGEIKNFLNALGLNEVLTYSLLDNQSFTNFGYSLDNAVLMQNPLSKEQETMRFTLMPSISQVISYNLRQKQHPVNIFEIAKIYLNKANSYPHEKYSLCIGMCGSKSWLNENLEIVNDEAGFLHLKGVALQLMRKIGLLNFQYKFNSINKFEFEFFVNNKKLGLLKKLNKEILNNLDIKNREVFLAELDLEEILNLVNHKRKFENITKFPGMDRDISLVVAENVFSDEIIDFIKQNSAELLSNVEITNYYKGKQIPEGYKNLTISCLYSAKDRTLNEEEVNNMHSGIVSALISKFQAKIR